MKDTMQTLKNLPKSTLLPAVGLVFFVMVAFAGVFIAQYQQNNRGPVAPTAPEDSQASGGICTTSWIAQSIPSPSPSPSPSVRPSPSPSPTPRVSPSPSPTIVCEDCNYQVDAFIGPVINNFNNPYQGQSGPARYSTNFGQGKRLIWAQSDEQNPEFPGCQNTTPTGNNGPLPLYQPGCENPVETGKIVYDMQSVNRELGYATIKVINETGRPNGPHPNINCTYPVGFVSYRANWSQGFTSQRVNDLVQRTLYPSSSQEMIVRLPMNNETSPNQCTTIPVACTNQNQITPSMFVIPGHGPYPTDGSEDPDVVTYLNTGTLPAFYHIVGEMVEQSSANIVFMDETGYLNPGQSITVNYPPVCTLGQTTPCPWGTTDENGAYEAHVTVNFSAMVQGENCGNVGGNWDRWYHPVQATFNVKNTSLPLIGSTRRFEVYSGTTKLEDANRNTVFSVPAGKTVNVSVGVPANSKSLTFKSLDGTLRLNSVTTTSSDGSVLSSKQVNTGVGKNRTTSITQ